MWKRIAIVCALSFVVMSVPARAEEEQKTEADTETEEDPLAA